MKGSSRNSPCHCGSGVKAKKCPCRTGAARIVKFDHPALSTVSEQVYPEDDLRFLRTMELACIGDRGVGLAANQIGVTKRAIFVFADRMNGRFMLNPVISWKSETIRRDKEGCLSYPGFETQVERHDEITVAWFDEGFAQEEKNFFGWESRIIQHEVDHLDGICRVGDAWRALHLTPELP